MSVLIIDDNAVMRRIITYAVRDLTDRIIKCSSGAEALSAYSRNP